MADIGDEDLAQVVANAFRQRQQNTLIARQIDSQNRFRDLASQYASATPENRDAIGAQLYGIDPASAEKLVGFTQQQSELRAADAVRQAKQTALKLYAVANAPPGQAEATFQASAPAEYQKAVQAGLLTPDMQPDQREQLVRQTAQQHLPGYMAQAGLSTAPEIKAVPEGTSLVGISPMGGAPSTLMAGEKKPQDELSKLNKDYKDGLISSEDYKARRVLMTTRAPNMYSDLGNPEQTDAMAKAIANYQLPPPSPMRMQTPQGKALLAQVLAVNPDYAAEEFGSRNKAYKDFASGKQGDQVRAFNVGISHLNTAQELASALDNGDIRIVNAAKQRWAEEFGSPAPGNFDAAKQIIKAEVVKAISGSGGGQEDRDKALAVLNTASSPAALAGGIQTAQRLMGGQIGGLKRQYEQSTGRKDFQRLLSPDSATFLQTKEATGDSKTPPSGPVKVNTPAEAMQLPSGTQFMTPDGRIKVRP